MIQPKPMLGTVHGSRIDLDEPLGLAEGQRILVEVRSADEFSADESAVRRCAGSLAGLPDTVDDDLRVILDARKESSFREIDP